MKRISYTLLCLFLAYNTLSVAQVINAGVCGNNTAQLLQRMETDVINKAPDLVIMMVGTNDMINRNKMLSYEAYTQNYKRIVSRLKQEGIDVLLMTSPPVDSAYVFTRHPRSFFPDESPCEKMAIARDIVCRIAEEEGLHLLDQFHLFSEINVPCHNQDLFIRNPRNSGLKDGVHPTALGYYFLATNVFQYLEENKMLHSGMKIICFGDSITYSQGVKGAGTSNGKTYPSLLQTMINEKIK